MSDEDILSDLFHHCALVAFIEQARAQQGPPDCEATRRRAYDLYEAELRNRRVPISDE